VRLVQHDHEPAPTPSTWTPDSRRIRERLREHALIRSRPLHAPTLDDTVAGAYWTFVHYPGPGRARSVRVGGTDIMAQAKHTTTLHPLHDRVLIKRIEDEPARRGAIIIPDSAKEKPQEGKVIAVGKGRVSEDGKKIPLDVKAGDRVLFGKYSGNDITLDGQDLLIMKEEDVLGVIAS